MRHLTAHKLLSSSGELLWLCLLPPPVATIANGSQAAVQPGPLTIHAERGAAMTSKAGALLLSALGVTKTHARPPVSNDNPYSVRLSVA